ncbi:MAG: hypothetical protein AUF67_12900 [Acidobacteria bacterium 13_1_20CM_58_21]|nr:MAG: hypothetical protein AUF67_12900 [Acidobacteria bacterium 13_1_20CM_58_21]
MTLATGSKLGPYEIVGPLGAGGMGEVYRARDTRLDRTVAIKILPAQLSADPLRKQRFALQGPIVFDPALAFFGRPFTDGLGRSFSLHEPRPSIIRAVELGRAGLAGAVGLAALTPDRENENAAGEKQLRQAEGVTATRNTQPPPAEEVYGDQVLGVIVEKGSPRLGGSFADLTLKWRVRLSLVPPEKKNANRIIGLICPFLPPRVFVKCPSVRKMDGRGGGDRTKSGIEDV